MSIKFHLLLAVLALMAVVHRAAAQGAQFFRIAGPTATTITSLRADGTLVWSNALPGAAYTIQTVISLPGGSNWVDYNQFTATNAVNTNHLNAFNPPAGMAFIPSGPFIMGDTLDGESDAEPTNATLSATYMDTNLVSYSQWQSVYAWAINHGYVFDDVGSGKKANNPVQTVKWYDAVKWCNARSQQAGLTPVYYTDPGLTKVYTNGDVDLGITNVNWTANGYRLPTEAEWEKSARGGLSGQRFPWGDTISETKANYYGFTSISSYDLGPNGFNAVGAAGGLPYTSPVGSFPANNYGLFDMAGNVSEWCWDWYGVPYAGGTNPKGPNAGLYRVVRGGSWDGYANYLRCAFRTSFNPNISYYYFGFRCVRSL
jgi:formylglycine-generating enzyme required for sulfatase activity